MYKKDLTQKSDPRSFQHGIQNLAIGWLDKDHVFPTGNVSSEFIKKLSIFCGTPLIGLATFGVHFCELCDNQQISITTPSGEKFALGSSEIRIPSLDGKFYYAAPDLIIHYVAVHHYTPPDEFVSAVISFQMPGTHQFNTAVRYWLPKQD